MNDEIKRLSKVSTKQKILFFILVHIGNEVVKRNDTTELTTVELVSTILTISSFETFHYKYLMLKNLISGQLRACYAFYLQYQNMQRTVRTIVQPLWCLTESCEDPI